MKMTTTMTMITSVMTMTIHMTKNAVQIAQSNDLASDGFVTTIFKSDQPLDADLFINAFAAASRASLFA